MKQKLFTLFLALLASVGIASATPMTCADAMAMGNALADNAETDTVVVEGFAVNVTPYDITFGNQQFYLADDAASTTSDLMAFRAKPTKNGAAYPVLAGDKVQLKGTIKKYVKEGAAPIIEVMYPSVTFVTEVAGNRTLATTTEITVAKALEIGTALSEGAITKETYDIVGYVTQIDDNSFNTSYKNMIFWIADENNGAATNAAGAFEVYRGKPTQELKVGDKVSVKTKIQNYKGTIESISSAPVNFLEDSAGTCGDNLTWRLSNGTLTISGTGAMADYSSYTDVPWYDYHSFIKSIVINDGVTSIGDYAFSDCSSLTSVTIPNSVTSIGTSAFVYCSSLTSVILTALSEEEFCKGQGNSLLYSKGVNYQREIQINGTKVTKFTIPNSVTSIGDEAFRGCSSLTSVTIPNSVTSIGWSAFYGCSSLTSVTIPNSVTSIGGFAFNGCSSLTSITIPNSMTSIGIGTFQSCTGLTSVTIGNSVTSIGSSAFSGCSSLSSVTIHNSVTSIGGSAFEGCSKLTSMTIPNSVTSIGIGAFEGCTGFTSVTIPNSVTNIGNNAFYGCTSLTSVTIEADTPPTIGIYCFYYYEDGKDFPLNISIYVPCGSLDTYKTAEGWSDYASLIRYAPYSSYNINKKAENGHITTSSTNIFTMCDTEHPVICTANPNRGCYFVRWADGNTENPRTIELTQDTTMEAIFDYLLTGKCGKDSALTWTFEPASMALNITGKGALSENYTYGTFIESLTIGNEVTTIGEDAFYKCTNLKNVIIGSAVKVLEKRAFYNCSSIETITCYSMRPPTVNQDALYGLDYSTIVYVPADYLNTYKMHDAWGLYDVRPLGATSAETEDVKITPSENEANVTWPSVNGSATYELVIKDKDGNIVCTFIFNANGQLTSIAFNAPSRNGVPAQTQIAGFSFTITGLDSGTGYDLTLTAKDNSGNAIQTETISFVTTGGNVSTDMDQVQSNEIHSTKVIKDGQVLILRNGKTYTMQGQEVK